MHGPTNVTNSMQNLHFQRVSGFRVQYTGPNSRSVTPTFMCFSKKKKKKGERERKCANSAF